MAFEVVFHEGSIPNCTHAKWQYLQFIEHVVEAPRKSTTLSIVKWHICRIFAKKNKFITLT